MSLWLLLLVMSLTTARVTRLLNKDSFPPIRWARVKIVTFRPPVVTKHKGYLHDSWVELEADPDQDYWWLGELITCPWCASAYVSAAAVFGYWGGGWHSLPVPFLCWFAVWAVGAALAAGKIN